MENEERVLCSFSTPDVSVFDPVRREGIIALGGGVLLFLILFCPRLLQLAVSQIINYDEVLPRVFAFASAIFVIVLFFSFLILQRPRGG